MAKYAAVQPPEGLEDAWGVIHFLANPDKAGEAMAYIDQLEALLAEINASIEKTVKVEEVDALRTQIGLDKLAAAQALKDAEAKAAEILAEAFARTDAVAADRAKLTADQAALDRQQAEGAAQYARDLTALQARLGAADRREQELAAREAAVTQAKAEAETIRAELLVRAEAVQRAVAG